MPVKFGPSGLEEDAVKDGINIVKVPQYIKNQDLECFEYSFGHGYNMSIATANIAGQKFQEFGIKLSLHAPFYINFANPDEVMYQKSVGYLYTGIKFMNAFNCDRLIFHAASAGKADRSEAVNLTTQRLKETLEKMELENALEGKFLCPETMGKSLQIGTYKEILDICTISDKLLPTFDFGHINSISQGGLKTSDDYKRIFDYSIDKIGFERTSNCHIHFSKIQFGEKGELRHLNYNEDLIYGPNFEPLAKVLIDYKLEPRIICESADKMVSDAKFMKKIYKEMLDNNPIL